ncbi:MAG: Ig-like domain-containing protein, partial [Lacibacter sp.]
ITFDEYIELRSANEKVLISPYPTKDPVIESKLRTLTIRLKDSLLPNTTYSIDFGDAIVDLNEGNPLKNFRYTFSTGSTIDSSELTGRIVLAENGKTDSTMFAVLYTKQQDSTVAKEKPKYVARVDGKGNFHFTNLPEGTFYIYALKDEDGDKKYSQPIEQFAFLDSPILINANTKPVKLYAFAAEKEKKRAGSSGTGAKGDKAKMLISSNSLEAGAQDFLDSFKLSYQKPIRHFDSSKIILFLDSTKQVTDLLIKNDSLNKQLVLYTAWKEGGTYKLFLNKDYATDTSGLSATKNDTISFRVKTEKEYGSVRITFKNLDTSLHPVLIFYTGEQIFASYPVNDLKWYRKLFKPGNYQLGILYDANQNGVWDAGDFFAKPKRQPEIVQQLINTITIKDNWDNELVIDLNNQQPPVDKNQKPAGPDRRNF